MGKKRETKPTWRSTRSRYFPDGASVQTLKPIQLRLQSVVNDLNMSASMNFLDSSGVNLQIVYNLLILWAAQKIEEKGVRGLVKELRPALEELERMAAERLVEDGKEIDPKYLPEGVSFPRKANKAPE